MSNVVSPEYANAYVPIVCTVDGMSTDARFSHPAKTYVSMVTTVSGIEIDRRAAQSRKASAVIVTSPSGITACPLLSIAPYEQSAAPLHTKLATVTAASHRHDADHIL